MSASRLQLAIEQITFARNYTIWLLNHTDPAEWFQQPADVTHIAWQVGHLAFSEYRLALQRIRGERPEDATLISDDFRAQFSRDSVPADPAQYPSPAEIRAVFERVHQQALLELRDLDERELDAVVLKPHPLVKTKFWSLLWCAQHEAVHAGQIGLLRRQLGHPPLW
jgi:hypothetical protein